MKRIVPLLVIATLSASCLTTRSQLRNNSSQDTYSSQSSAVDEMKVEIARLSEKVEELQKGDGNNRMMDIEKRLTEIENTQMESLSRLKTSDQPQTGKEPVQKFVRGIIAFNSGDYSTAIDKLSEYLAHSKSKNHLQEATYLRGESYFALKRYKKAIVDFSRFPETWTKSRRVPLALYRIAVSFEGLGMKGDAKAFYQDLVARYPKSPEARKAKKALRN